MAMLPCDLHGKRVFGPNAHVYPALVSGTSQERASVRICTDHVRTIMDLAERMLVAVDSEYIDDKPVLHECIGCERPVDDEAWRFFMTVYPKSEKRHDYYGLLHPDCRPPEWAEALLGAAPQDRRTSS